MENIPYRIQIWWPGLDLMKASLNFFKGEYRNTTGPWGIVVHNK